MAVLARRAISTKAAINLRCATKVILDFDTSMCKRIAILIAVNLIWTLRLKPLPSLNTADVLA